MFLELTYIGFNTVNGKYCCNAVITVATISIDRFNTVNGKYCCNLHTIVHNLLPSKICFNTVNGKYCCNNIKRFTFLYEGE